MYVQASDDRRMFLASVEQGWVEIRSGLGDVVKDDDDFFDAVIKQIRNSDLSPGQEGSEGFFQGVARFSRFALDIKSALSTIVSFIHAAPGDSSLRSFGQDQSFWN